MDRRVVCIKTNAPRNDCTCITDIGTEGNDRLIEVYEVVNRIDSKTDRFYVIDPNDGSRVWVVTVPRGNRKYIRTKANDTPDDNLLQLPECNALYLR